VHLQAGVKIPADGILLTKDVNVNESNVTGGPEEIHKTGAMENMDMDSFVLSGSLVIDGEGMMLALAVGSSTVQRKLEGLEHNEGGHKPKTTQNRELSFLVVAIIGFGIVAGYIIGVIASILGEKANIPSFRGMISHANYVMTVLVI
jgi:Ca2+-transporting ATPase